MIELDISSSVPMDEKTVFWRKLSSQLSKIPGGYNYMGAASDQYCFPLKKGGELRIMVEDETYPEVHVDLYGGELPGISGSTIKTGDPNGRSL